MTIEAMVKIIEELTPEETKMVREAYREFLNEFTCDGCPVLMINEDGYTQTKPFMEFVMKKQDQWPDEPCRLCHGFPILLPEKNDGCPCLILGKDDAHKRLIELVDSWTE